ncbi:DUF4304 domain-containing protein [Isoptericola aurantiacus]|uniref:DUF4304 domain-containing protein n=1 Tax=Isoptericola aurantiacus TaxID=3377839 RepID=UPI00383ACDB6
MPNSNLVEAFKQAFKPLGFKKKVANWYRSSGDLYTVVGLQDSSWDGSNYVNIGFAPVAYAKSGWLADSKCLVRFRAESITSISRDSLILLSGRTMKEVAGDDLRAAVLEHIANPVARVVDPVEDIQDLKMLLRTKVSDQVFIHRDIKKELD